MASRAIALILLVYASSLLGEESAVSALWRSAPTKLALDTWKRPKADREKLLAEFKAQIPPTLSKPERNLYLACLGDRAAVEEAVEDYMTYPGFIPAALQQSRSPFAIEYLSPHFFADEPYSESRGDIIVRPASFMAVFTATGVLAESPAFSSEVGNWARGLRDCDPTLLRAEIRRWWNENREAFSNEDFKGVKPGRPVKTQFEVIKENRVKLGLSPDWNSAQPQPRAIRTSVAATNSPERDTGQPSSVIADDGNSGMMWVAGAVVALLLAGLVLISIQRR